MSFFIYRAALKLSSLVASHSCTFSNSALQKLCDFCARFASFLTKNMEHKVHDEPQRALSFTEKLLFILFHLKLRKFRVVDGLSSF
jgi:hypothetical protein